MSSSPQVLFPLELGNNLLGSLTPYFKNVSYYCPSQVPSGQVACAWILAHVSLVRLKSYPAYSPSVLTSSVSCFVTGCCHASVIMLIRFSDGSHSDCLRQLWHEPFSGRPRCRQAGASPGF